MKTDTSILLAKLIESYKSGDLDTSLSLAMKLLQIDPDSIVPLQYAARVHTKRREPQFAKPFWDKLTSLNPALPEPFLQSARIARLEKNWEACEGYIDEFIRQKPDHAEAIGIQIQCCLESRDAKKIGAAFTRLSRINPTAIPPLALRAVEANMGIDVAKSLCKAAGSSNQPALELRAKLAQATREAAIAFEIQNDPFAASSCYQAMQIYAPESSFPTTALSRLCRPFLQKAQAFYRDKNYADAIEQAKFCIKIAPKEAEPYSIAGHSSAQLGQHQDAFDILHAEIELFWQNSWLVINYARAAIQVGKPEVAYAAYSAVKSRDDDKSNTYEAECDRQLDELSKNAAQDMQALLDRDEILLACEKIFSCQKSGLTLSDFPALVTNLRELGEIRLRELCEFEDYDALEFAKNLVRLDPLAEYAYSVAGRLLINNRMHAEAHYYWSQLNKLDEKKTEPWLNLARCYVNLNNKLEATNAASALLALDPDHEEGQKILALAAEMKTLSRERAP